MNAVVFTGPTLSAGEAMEVLEARYLPPAEQGDVYREALARPRAIGLIDGYFQSRPAVWHKEILWAMSRGIHVFGSASMGALRAAELADFGMEGVGAIFEAYRDGSLEDDDEVAVVHEPAERGFRATSEAMVDVRHTLGLAAAAGVIRAGTAARLQDVAKSMFYPRRTYRAIVGMAAELGVATAELEAFERWLPGGRASQKRADAIAMLRLMRARLEAGLEPKKIAYSFQSSVMWEVAKQQVGAAALTDDVLDELRLDGDRYFEAERSALLRVLAVNLADLYLEARPEHPTPALTREFWRRHGVEGEAGEQAWMEANAIDEGQLASLLEDERRLRWVRRLARNQLGAVFVDELRLRGEYPRLAERARAKKEALEAQGLDRPRLEDIRLSEDELLGWYFEHRLGRRVPDDLHQYSRDLGCARYEEFRTLVLREYCYRRSPTT